MIKSLFIYLCCTFSLLAMHPDAVIQIYEDSAVGDKNQINGVVNALKKTQKKLIIVDHPCKKDVDIVKLTQNILDKCKRHPNKHYLVIGVGKTAWAVFESLTAKCPGNLKIALLSHQWSPAHDTLLGKIHWMAVPDYAIPDAGIDTGSTILIHTNGVSHNVSAKTLVTKIKMQPNDRFVILGGDAPDANGMIKRFTEHDTKRLTESLIKQNPDGHFYITNGPRTGKYNDKGEEIPNAHRTESIDYATDAFIKALKNLGVNEKRIHLHDFKFGKPSMYLPLLAAAHKASAVVWVPGESSSMISEVISCIAPKNAIVYWNAAMNETHQKQMDSVYIQGRSSLCDKYGDTKAPLETKKAKPLPDAADQIATAIIGA